MNITDQINELRVRVLREIEALNGIDSDLSLLHDSYLYEQDALREAVKTQPPTRLNDFLNELLAGNLL
jgi:hypothetical protein